MTSPKRTPPRPWKRIDSMSFELEFPPHPFSLEIDGADGTWCWGLLYYGRPEYTIGKEGFLTANEAARAAERALLAELEKAARKIRSIRR